MKKNHITSVLLALSLIACVAPMQAAQEKTKEQKISFKEKAKKQFYESLDRFKRCMKGECTKWELAKAGRDLTIAITTLIAGLYVAAKAISPDYTPKTGEQYEIQSEHKRPHKITIRDMDRYNITKFVIV